MKKVTGDIVNTMDLRTYTLLRVLQLIDSANESLTANELAAFASWGDDPCLELPSGVDELEYMDIMADSGLLSKDRFGRFVITDLGRFYLSKLQEKRNSPDPVGGHFRSFTIT